ncbi:MAG: hypothetical protein WC229_03605 [Candidatus Paceibacterota bacterium]|jgi:hypothetical protein
MKTKIVITAVIIIFALVGLSISSVINSPQNIIACTQEAKICPDGSSVGRIGPRCEFTECPKTVTQTNVISTTTQNTNVVIPNVSKNTKLNKKVIISGISITPIELISDSRCPVDVQCVWAGTVDIKVKIEFGTSVQESVISLGNSVKFLNVGVELKNVLPQPYARVSIKPENYYFEFNVVPAEAIKNNNTEKPIF